MPKKKRRKLKKMEKEKVKEGALKLQLLWGPEILSTALGMSYGMSFVPRPE